VVTYDYIQDPGHGWLKVPVRDVMRHMFERPGQDEHWPYQERRISWFSPINGAYIYLEEDCDMGAFLAALEEDGIGKPNIHSVIVEDGDKRNPRNF
jgi:hypothetical protein